MSVPNDPSMASASAEGQPPRPPWPVQFSIRHLLVFVLAVSVLLALTTQLRHVGFTAFCFLAAAGIGKWRHKRWLTAASVTALLVFTITYLTCWVSLGYASVMNDLQFKLATFEFPIINEALQEYAETAGEFPESLQALAKVQQLGTPLGPSGEPLDPWNHPFRYRRTGDDFELASLGRDGQVGGAGLDADLDADDNFNGLEIRLPLSQFLFETSGSGQVFVVATVAAVLAGVIWFTRPITETTSTTSMVGAIVVTTIAAVVVAAFLAAFHVAASQSGH